METGQLTSKKKTKVDRFYWEFERDGKESTLFYDRITSCLISRFYDYETDRRGDIGSFVRQGALKSLVKIVRVLHTADKKSDGARWLRPCVPQRMMCEFMKQMIEPLSRLRLTCVEEMKTICTFPKLENPLYVQQNAIEHLMEFNKSTLDLEIAWRCENVVLTQFASLWAVPEYQYYLIAGFCKSVNTVGTQKKGLMLESLDRIVANHGEVSGEKARLRLLLSIFESFLKILKTPRLLRAIGFRANVYKTLGAIMEREYFLVFLEEDIVFPELLALIFKSVPRAIDKNVRVCGALIKLLLQVLRFPHSRTQTLEALVAMLVCSFGSVRKRLGEDFYTALLTFGEEIFDEETNEEIQDQLLMAEWGGNEVIGASATAAQHKICDLAKLNPENKYDPDDSD